MNFSAGLRIPIDDAHFISVFFRGERAVRAANNFAKLSFFPLVKTPLDAAAVSVFSDSAPSAYDSNILSSEIPAWEKINGNFLQLWLSKPLYKKTDVRTIMRILYLSVFRAASMNGIFCAVLHGALLSIPKSNQSAVLFGPGGMGKSTASCRWNAQGGTALADDMLLLFRNQAGKLCARPLPTLSRYPEPCRYQETREVQAIFRLQRGGDDRIVPADPKLWNLDFLNALLLHYGGSKFFAVEMQPRIFDAALNFVHNMPPCRTGYDILGDLQGHIFNHVQEFLKNEN